MAAEYDQLESSVFVFRLRNGKIAAEQLTDCFRFGETRWPPNDVTGWLSVLSSVISRHQSDVWGDVLSASGIFVSRIITW